MFWMIGLAFSCCSVLRLSFSESILTCSSAFDILLCAARLASSMLPASPAVCCAAAPKTTRNIIDTAIEWILFKGVSYFTKIPALPFCRMIRNLRQTEREVEREAPLLNKEAVNVQKRDRSQIRRAKKGQAYTVYTGAARHGTSAADP